MLLRIPQILDADDVAEIRRGLDTVDWVDGRATAGDLAEGTKRNRQARYDHPETRRLGDLILTRLERHPVFMSAALPHKVVPPLFNLYAEGSFYGPHMDGAIRPIEGTPHRVRTDLSATLFLSAAKDYDGGELIFDDGSATHRIKLDAGDMVLYSADTVHRVEPVTRGARLASFFWVQSMVRDEGERGLLFKLDGTIQQLRRDGAAHDSVVELMNLYHALLRRWADT
ncbi:MAG TPA: Fe2+-dependent dioxygenase [Alphaproteobacteria bacterium]|nr:Fe2+-dependent dioxygenase [Alphaproteobacteria bacterium]